MSYSISDLDHALSHRRLGFLNLLSDKKYCDSYERLLSGDICKIMLLRWDHFMIECGSTVSCLLHHMIWWFQPTCKEIM